MGNGSDNQGFLGIRNTVSTIITVIKMLENKCSVVFKPSMESITYITEQLGGGGFIPFGWVADGINHKAFLPLKE